MSKLLEHKPYSKRLDDIFLQELNELHSFHQTWSEGYSRIVSSENSFSSMEKIPFLHVGIFKHLTLSTTSPDSKFSRFVQSSSTSGLASTISTDEKTSKFQSLSSYKILEDFIGDSKRPLLVLDSSSSLRQKGGFSARVMAALSLKPFATELFFLLGSPADPKSLILKQLECALNKNDELIVYGFSWILWQAWATNTFPQEILNELKTKKISFVHSGGWKKLEHLKVSENEFNEKLLAISGPGSSVLDYYGLVEQMGIIFPKCEHGNRHIPIWADIIIRNPFTLESVENEVGQIQLLNTITFGAPSFSVLTEDLGKVTGHSCPCGRSGKVFELVGRVPKSEVRGCSNV